MADPKKPDAPSEAGTEAGAQATDALGEEQLESVAGGVLIGLKPALAHEDLLAHKELSLEQAVSPGAVTQDTTFKFFKK
jgi:hypothetical protein